MTGRHRYGSSDHVANDLFVPNAAHWNRMGRAYKDNESGSTAGVLVSGGVQGPDRTGDRRPDCTSNGRACVA